MLIAGCGGENGGGGEQGGGSESAATTSATRSQAPTRAEYVAKADAFCADVLSSRQGIAVSRSFERLRRTPRDDPALSRKFAAHFRKVLMLSRSFRDDFKAIKPPPADRERIAELHRANDESIARLEDVVDVFQRGGNRRRALEEYFSAIAKADTLAEAYGFEVCARNRPE